LFTWLDYGRNPELYDVQQSAPWYTRIIVLSVVCGIALIVEIVVQYFLQHRMNIETPENHETQKHKLEFEDK
jgi:hypothetical protein